MINVKQIVGKNVVFYRKKQHLTQEQLAGLINIAPPSLSKIENGYTFPNSSTFEDLIKHLKIYEAVLEVRFYQYINILKR